MVKLYSVIPLNFYLFLLVCCCIIIFFTVTLLRLGTSMHDMSALGLDRMQRNLGMRPDRAFLIRKLRSQRTVSLGGGMFGHKVYRLDKEIEMSYRYKLLDFSITLLLCLR